MKSSTWGCLGLVLAALFGSRAWAEPFASGEAGRPNIIFILTDDQGYGDLSCHGKATGNRADRGIPDPKGC